MLHLFFSDIQNHSPAKWCSSDPWSSAVRCWKLPLHLYQYCQPSPKHGGHPYCHSRFVKQRSLFLNTESMTSFDQNYTWSVSLFIVTVVNSSQRQHRANIYSCTQHLSTCTKVVFSHSSQSTASPETSHHRWTTERFNVTAPDCHPGMHGHRKSPTHHLLEPCRQQVYWRLQHQSVGKW